MNFWTQPATCMPDSCFCEAIRAGAIAQPANFWSSFAFVVVAILVWLRGGRGLFAGALVFVGVGSAFYHASLTFAGQVADVAGMYAIATAAIFYGVRRVGAWWYLATNLVLIAVQIEWPGTRRFVFAGLLIGVLVSTKWSVWIGRALAVFAIGAVFWAVDLARVACAPESWLQGHAVWHVAGAIAAWMLDRHFGLTNQIKFAYTASHGQG